MFINVSAYPEEYKNLMFKFGTSKVTLQRGSSMRFSFSESYQRIPHFFLILYLITESLIGCRENRNEVTRES